MCGIAREGKERTGEDREGEQRRWESGRKQRAGKDEKKRGENSNCAASGPRDTFLSGKFVADLTSQWRPDAEGMGGTGRREEKRGWGGHGRREG